MEVFNYKGISSGKYVEGEIEALNQDEASFKLKEQKVIITNLIKTKKKKGEKKEKAKSKGFSLFGKKKDKSRGYFNFLKAVCYYGESRFAYFANTCNVEGSIRVSCNKSSH